MSWAQKDYFQLFSVPKRFFVDYSLIEERYLSMQRLVHPDRYASEDALMQRAAVVHSAYLSNAYQVLLDNHERAAYMLDLAGLKVDEQKDAVFDVSFLMQQMELREDLEDAKVEGSPHRILSLKEKVHSEEASLYAQFDLHYTQGELLKAKDVLLRMYFYRKAAKELAECL